MGKHGTYYWRIDHQCQVSLKQAKLFCADKIDKSSKQEKYFENQVFYVTKEQALFFPKIKVFNL
jgi:hypothetical protein